MSEDRLAPEGSVWVCMACGKTATDRYGGPGSTRGWDASCVMNSSLAEKESLVFEGDRVIGIKTKA